MRVYTDKQLIGLAEAMADTGIKMYQYVREGASPNRIMESCIKTVSVAGLQQEIAEAILNVALRNSAEFDAL